MELRWLWAGPEATVYVRCKSGAGWLPLSDYQVQPLWTNYDCVYRIFQGGNQMQIWLRHLGGFKAVQNKYGAIAILFGEVSLMCDDRESEDAVTLYRYRLRRIQQRRFACKKGSK